jgi:HEPN domain-containing protein
MDHKHWLRLGDIDLRCIANEMAASDKLWSVISFHAQLAAEKYLKAFLAFKGREPQKIHMLENLLKDAVGFDPSLVVLKEDCDELSFYSVDARYPEFEDRYDEDAAHRAVAAAERICEAIGDRL